MIRHTAPNHRRCSCFWQRLHPLAAVIIRSPARALLFSTTTRKDDDDDAMPQPPPPPPPNPNTHNSSATIIQGPSLLASTGVHRPSPSLFHLPGLRSLPFWTAPDLDDGSDASSSDPNQQQRGRRRIAFNDPIITAAIQHVESNYAAIRSEYFSAVLGLSNIDATTTTTTTTTNASNLSMNTNSGNITKPLEPDYDVSTRGGEHAEDALHSGTWDWHSYILNGRRNERFKEMCPKTAQVVDDVRVFVLFLYFVSLKDYYIVSTL